MKYYPIFLRVAGRPCLVIGGGRVAEQKVQSLRQSGAQVTVISPDLTAPLAALAATRQILHQQRRYTEGDLRGFWMAYDATGDEALHAHIAREAQEAGVLLNVVDRPQLCDFIVPSVMQRGDLVIATSTSGRSPALARRIRQDIEAAIGTEYDVALRLLGRIRERLAAQPVSAADRRRIFAALVASPLLDYLRARQATEVDRLLARTVGGGVSLASLGMELR
jgi:precorrin-2 dehydrogenase/sirohydrochlorin ferrochelatase